MKIMGHLVSNYFWMNYHFEHNHWTNYSNEFSLWVKKKRRKREKQAKGLGVPLMIQVGKQLMKTFHLTEDTKLLLLS